ncbi:hypothetical protein LCGC14_0617720 [marine sediment metagenome]|uniref:Uncharacterized protein n=1 Tax=marine sediment metagenome TaxID=412755 RepID=A0A0F9R5U0_9ZZZZ
MIYEIPANGLCFVCGMKSFHTQKELREHRESETHKINSQKNIKGEEKMNLNEAKFNEAKKITIEMTKSEDGKIYPKNTFIYLDGELAQFIRGVQLNAHVDEGLKMVVSYMFTKNGRPERDEAEYIERHWSSEVKNVSGVVLEEDEDEIELVEEEKNDR